MAYCVSSDVRLIVNTTLTDVEITGIIEMSDAEIDARIGTQTSGNKLIKKLSVLLSAHIIKQRQPRSVAAGEYSEDAGDILEVWEREIERIYRLYRKPKVAASRYGSLDEKTRYPEAI